MYNDANIQNGSYGYNIYNKDGLLSGFDEKGKAITLDEIYYSIENGSVIWRISFEYLGEIRHYEFPRCNISDKKFVAKLQGNGADITTKTFDCFVDSMRFQENQITTYRGTFEHLGWIKLAVNDNMSYCFRCSKLIGKRSAEYTGNLSLTPKGTLDEWVSIVRAEVLGRPALETILLAALSAPIVGLHGINTTTDNPIYHINFRSGQGKSTACTLVASTAGEPFEGMRNEYDKYGVLKDKFSILGSWGATPKATLSAHAGNRGITVVLNELGKFGGSDMTTIVFNLSEGSDIKRLNTQLETIVTEGFNTVFISCGEMSLVDRCKSKLEGIKNRVLEIAVPMTEDAEHARRIKDGCSNNNGFAVPMMAQYIIKNGGFEMIQNMYSDVLQELTATAPQGVSDRFIEKFPTFLVMAAKIAKDALDLTFDIDRVVDFCYQCVASSKEDDGDICKSFDEIIELFNINADNFFDNEHQDHTPRIVWGKIAHSQEIINNKRLVKTYYIYPNHLKKILKDLGYPNPATELKMWRDKGVLDCDEGHLTKKVNFKLLDTDKTRMYALQIWQDVQPKRKKETPYHLLNDDDNEIIEKEESTDGNNDSEGCCENTENIVSQSA